MSNESDWKSEVNKSLSGDYLRVGSILQFIKKEEEEGRKKERKKKKNRQAVAIACAFGAH